MQLSLEVIAGPHTGERFVFERHDTFLVGRSADAHLRLHEDNYFSRHHFLLEIQPPRCFLRDLGSRNGTKVNDQKATMVFLQDGDVISGGQTRIRFRIGELQDAEAVDPAGRSKADGPIANGAQVSESHIETEDIIRGLRIPGYEILATLGRGSMGMVYHGRETSSGREVALKVILPEQSTNETAIRNFLREASVLSQLDHARIIRFFQLGTTSHQFFFAMEYIPDVVNLQATLAALPRPEAVRNACVVVCQVLEALNYAHKLQMVHRDIKPTNILVSRDGDSLSAKLADFGLAKHFLDAGLSQMTNVGDVRGTLAYMPPEQLINCRDVRPSVDLFAVGASLYHLLSGTTIHDFPPDDDPFRVVLEDEPVPLGDRCTDLPAGLCDAIGRAIRRNPEERFDTAARMWQAILPYSRTMTWK